MVQKTKPGGVRRACALRNISLIMVRLFRRLGRARSAGGRGRDRRLLGFGRVLLFCLLLLAAARAEATLGEICDALRQEWGMYSEAPAF